MSTSTVSKRCADPSVGIAFLEHGADQLLGRFLGDLELRRGDDLDDLDHVGERGVRRDPGLGLPVAP